MIDISQEILDLANTKTINLIESDLTPAQLTELFKEITKKTPTVVEEVILSDAIAEVPSDILASALVKIKKINLTNAKYADVTSFFQLLGNDSSAVVEDIDLSDNLLCDIPPDTLATALADLKKIKLHYAQLTPLQINTLLTQISPAVEEINLEGVDLKIISPEALSALTRIKRLYLNRGNLREKHWIELFGQIITKNPLVMEFLYLGYWHEPHYEVPNYPTDLLGQIKWALVNACSCKNTDEDIKKVNETVNELLEQVKQVVKHVEEHY